MPCLWGRPCGWSRVRGEEEVAVGGMGTGQVVQGRGKDLALFGAIRMFSRERPSDGDTGARGGRSPASLVT